MQEKIKDILKEQEKQLEVDAILHVINEKEEEITEQSIKDAKNKLLDEKADKYISFEEQRREEHRKYTETYREEIKKEQEKKIEERKKRKKLENAIMTYEKQKEEVPIIDEEENEEETKSIIQKIKEFFVGKGTIISKEKEQPKKKNTNIELTRHQQFQQVLQEKVDEKNKLVKSKEQSKNKKELER